MNRRDFLKKMGLTGGGGFLLYTLGTGLLKACGWAEEPGEEPEEEPGEEPKEWEPAYARLEAEGKLEERIGEAYDILENCRLCPRRCGINRLKGEKGFCEGLDRAVVYIHQPHFGEELPLVGQGGSGTIFFSHCNLRCVFCQNWPIAHLGLGEARSHEELAEMMLDLQAIGCHNINLVTPTHVMPQILKAVRLALHKGLSLPLCYNTSGYERVEAIRLLDGIVDIYLPDMKFMDAAQAERYNLAAAADYPSLTREAIKEMYRQVGNLQTGPGGIARRGLMIRHLVMPNRVAGTREFVQWVAENLSKDTYVNIMAQYRVEFKAFEYEEIARAITSQEFVEAMDWAIAAGLTNLDQRSLAQLAIHRRLAS